MLYHNGHPSNHNGHPSNLQFGSFMPLGNASKAGCPVTAIYNGWRVCRKIGYPIYPQMRQV